MPTGAATSRPILLTEKKLLSDAEPNATILTSARQFNNYGVKMAEQEGNNDGAKNKKNEMFSEQDKNKLEEAGSTIPNPMRHLMEAAFGKDLGHVKVHSDANAVRMSSLLGAKAFSHGSHIVFGAGEYNPAHPEGMKLLQHELTHVMQQQGPKGE